MGLFQGKQQSKKSSKDDPDADVQHFFDEHFREELRNHGRWYFEKIITENATLFKQDLDDAISVVKDELKERMSKQIDEQLVEFSKAMKEAQETALESLGHGAKVLEEQRQQLSESLHKNITDQEAAMTTVIKDAQDLALQSINRSGHALDEQYQHLSVALHKNITDQETAMANAVQENQTHLAAVKAVQDQALQSLSATAEALQEQRQQLAQLLVKNVANQEAVLVGAFEDNMAQVVEHYLLGALGDQYDLKAQLPAIIKQMEDNKQAIVDDVKL